jgi:transcriptional regulator with XRE-family HTH domain
MINELKARAARANQICLAHGLTQADIAAHVGASQSQVCRVLKGRCQRPSRLFEEVCLFVERHEAGVTPEEVRKNQDLVDALASTWDGSATHAKALAAVIRSLAILGTSGR